MSFFYFKKKSKWSSEISMEMFLIPSDAYFQLKRVKDDLMFRFTRSNAGYTMVRGGGEGAAGN